jgi:LuxR family maltose regulon positive regulatory protein
MPATIVLVDDHPVFRRGLYHLLAKEKDLTVAGEAGDGQTAIDLVRRKPPDLVVMDISMPNLDGIEATRQILSECPDTKILALSVNSGKQFVRDMIQAGASGYILKESIPEEMLTGIRTVLSGDVYLSKSISNLLISDYKTLIPESEQPLEVSLAPILYTKLHRPPISAHIVPSTRLLEILENHIENPITLIAAPAGYGKSILASLWLEVSRLRGGWVSLDEGDNDVRVFLSYVLEAIQRLFPQKPLDAKSLLEGTKLPSVEVLGRYLLNDLERISERFILVLDDYHCIRNAAIDEFIAALLVHPSSMMHLVLLTRRDPPLPLSSLRSRGRLTEIAMEQLRFTALEIKSFLERFLRIPITNRTAQVIEEKTEGWVTGVHLAALSIRHEADQERLTAGLLETSQYVWDYLIQEALSQVAPKFDRYLLHSAILDRFCAPLCEALSTADLERNQTDPSGQEFIDWLNKTHLFIIPLDATGKWFRYHHLFRELLHNQLELKLDPDEIATIHSRAGEWFAGKGLIDEAITHALATGNPLAAARIVERNRHAILDADRWHVLGAWLDRLPDQIKQERPDLLLGQAWILLLLGQLAGMLPVVERVESLLDADAPDPATLSEISFFRGFVCYLQGEGGRSADFFAKATAPLPENAFNLLGAEAEYWTCVALHLDGQKETAIQRLEKGIFGREPQEGMVLSRLIFGLCFIHMLEGEWLQAFQEGSRLEEISILNRRILGETWAMYVQGNGSFQMYDLEAARHHFSQVVKNRYITHPRAVIDAMAGLAITCQFMGKADEADATMRLAQEYAQWTKVPEQLEIVHSCRARLALLRGDFDSASHWQMSLRETPANPVMLFFLEIPIITNCRLLIAIGSDAGLNEAVERLKYLRLEFKSWHNTCQMMELMVLQSVALEKLGRAGEALSALEEAVALAGPRGWIRPFAEWGPTMAKLLRRLVKKGVAVDHIGKFLAAFGDEEPARAQDAKDHETPPSPPPPIPTSPGPAIAQPLVEPLTNRELDVLELLAERMQNKEIADRLSISPETVKGHLKSIYQKLSAGNRRQAVQKAKALRILGER